MDTSRKIVVITGCSSGIGLQTALLMAKAKDRPYKVYATMRNLSKKGELEENGKEVLNKTLFIRQLDVTKEDSVRDFFTTLMRDEGRIDVLVNNAGVTHFGIVETVPFEEIRSTMDTNFFGAVRTIQATLPVMKRQESGRIVNVSSLLGIRACPFSEAYAASKFALEGFSEALAPSVRKFNIFLSTVQFGPVGTPIRDREQEMFSKVEYDKTDEKTGHVMRDFQKAYENVVDANRHFHQSAEEAGRFLVKVVEDEAPKFAYQSSDMVSAAVSAKLKDPTGETTVATASKTYLGD